MNDRAELVPSRMVVDPVRFDPEDPTGYLGVTLNGGFLPYLQSVARPEIAIFARASIRERNQPDEALVWEKVYLNSSGGDFIALNKRASLPRLDIPILPPILYEGQDVFIEIRVIELDQEDNARLMTLVNAASRAAATFQPASSAGISVFQTALSFIASNNPDDIEFQFDFTLSDSGQTATFDHDGTPRRFDSVLRPRVGTFAVIKTEHAGRLKVPSNYLRVAESGARYAMAELLRVGTLGIVNWPWARAGCKLRSLTRLTPEDCRATDAAVSDSADLYHRLLGRPFGLDYGATEVPLFNERGVLASSAWDGWEYRLVDHRIVQIPASGPRETWDYDEQGYLVFSIVAAGEGVDAPMMQRTARRRKAIESLEISTGELSSRDLDAAVRPLVASLGELAGESRARTVCAEQIAAAKTSAEVSSAKSVCMKEAEKRNADASRRIESFAGKLAERRMKTVAGPSLALVGDGYRRLAGGRLDPLEIVVRCDGVSDATASFDAYLQLGDARDLIPIASGVKCDAVATPNGVEVARAATIDTTGLTLAATPPLDAALVIRRASVLSPVEHRVPVRIAADPQPINARIQGATLGQLWKDGLALELSGQNLEHVTRIFTFKGGKPTASVPAAYDVDAKVLRAVNATGSDVDLDHYRLGMASVVLERGGPLCFQPPTTASAAPATNCP